MYNVHDSESRDLADWLETHLKADKEREEREEREKREAETKAVALATECNCSRWEYMYRYKDLAVTFSCPEHGMVTLDFRDVPAPTPIAHTVSRKQKRA